MKRVLFKLQFKRLQRHDASSVSDVQYIHRLHYYHPSDACCKRMLAFITGKCFIEIYYDVFYNLCINK